MKGSNFMDVYGIVCIVFMAKIRGQAKFTLLLL